jgi:hypothetical protein
VFSNCNEGSVFLKIHDFEMLNCDFTKRLTEFLKSFSNRKGLKLRFLNYSFEITNLNTKCLKALIDNTLFFVF